MLRANATIMVMNLERSLDFYTRVLGFLPGGRHLDHFAEVKAPELTLVLHPRRKGTQLNRGEGLSIGLQVAELEVATRRLEAEGVSFTFQENDANRLAHFTDPDGTPLYFLEVMKD